MKRDYIAVCKGNVILEVLSNEKSRFDAFACYGPGCYAVWVTAEAFMLYSDRAYLKIEAIYVDGKVHHYDHFIVPFDEWKKSLDIVC